ncbi:MAG: HIT domain-containing protein [Rickettsiales bacterium]|nr:MAG: HIT domain-containing protein [Rickettsiales bacterium]
MYDKNNVFAKIIRSELPSEKIYEDEILIAIKNINPVAPFHILVIPKNNYVDFADFIDNALSDEINHYFRKINEIAKENNIADYRIVSNKGAKAGQSVFHFHTHIISGFDNPDLINENL